VIRGKESERKREREREETSKKIAREWMRTRDGLGGTVGRWEKAG